MAFFDSNLMSLKLAKERDEATVARMVQRLTSEPAEIFGLDVGTLEIGAQADMVLINPDALDGWQPDQTRKLEYREIFGHQQMVNRPEGHCGFGIYQGCDGVEGRHGASCIGSGDVGPRSEGGLRRPYSLPTPAINDWALTNSGRYVELGLCSDLEMTLRV